MKSLLTICSCDRIDPPCFSLFFLIVLPVIKLVKEIHYYCEQYAVFGIIVLKAL